MTIAAGFYCEDGIVICADTEQTDYVGKYQRSKIFFIDNQLVVTGAGSSDYIKMAFDKLADEYRASQPVNHSDAREIVEEMILELHQKHIFQFYQPSDRERPGIELVIAMRCSDGKPVLIKTADTATILGSFCETVGAGRPLFDYWAQLLYQPGLPMKTVAFLAAFILSQVKQNVVGCGGYSFVMGLPNDPAKKVVSTLTSDNSIFAGFPGSAVPLLNHCRNLEMSDAEYEGLFKGFMATLWAIRQGERIRKNAQLIMEHGLMPTSPLGTEETEKKLLRLIEEKKKAEAESGNSTRSEPQTSADQL